ncbi:ubiquitin-protein ligase 7 [Wolffia australiana]
MMSVPPPTELKKPRNHQASQVSLRGASAKEISRDALLDRVSHERELRNHQRRRSAAALSIQRRWRGYNGRKVLADQLEGQWEALTDCSHGLPTGTWISIKLLRPFLLFATPRWLNQTYCWKNTRNISNCIKVVLQSIACADLEKNFCSLALGTVEEKATWLYQAKKLLSLCSSLLANCNPVEKNEDKAQLTAVGMRLIISLTNILDWKIVSCPDIDGARALVRNLLEFMTTTNCGLYVSMRIYLTKLDIKSSIRDEYLIVTASVITLALRPFNMKNQEPYRTFSLDAKLAAEKYCNYILTIPCLSQRLPSFILPALRHQSSLAACLQVPLITDERSDLHDQSGCQAIPAVGWFFANMINLSSEQTDNSGRFIASLDLKTYAHFINRVSEKFLSVIESTVHVGENEIDEDSSETQISSYGSQKASFLELLKPVHQQWYLRNLLSGAESSPFNLISKDQENKILSDILLFYYNMLRIYAFLDPPVGPLPILNMLSFTPGFIRRVWEYLKELIFRKYDHLLDADGVMQDKTSGSEEQKMVPKVSGLKWANVLAKITGKLHDADGSQARNKSTNLSHVSENESEFWVVKPVMQGCHGISRETQHVLFLFCCVYTHLLLVLDDIEFYEKQVPFNLDGQRRISSLLNTFVCGSFIHNCYENNKLLLDAAVRCLTLLYERDSRHQFCPPSLWVAPAPRNRLPIPAAARSHIALSCNSHVRVASGSHGINSLIFTMPHVFPFEERVQMFREFIQLDKVSRRAAGELTGPGPRSLEIVIRRDNLIEDGFNQLNYLGPKLKSPLNISFIGDAGLPEAGVDYGGLSKEFLTDILKAAFDPKYGYFCQSSTSEGFLIPNACARFLDNGIEMIEFMGRMVGKALYEGILLEYCFSLSFVQKLVGSYSFLDELSTLDPELYRNLMYIKNYDGDVKELALDFTMSEDLGGKRALIELIPGGKDIPVTNENKLPYIYAIADYKLNLQIRHFANAFFRGLTDLISPSWLRIFTAKEFNQLLSGGTHEIDVEDLRSNTKYTGGYTEDSRTIKLFWEVVRDFSSHERSLLLKFITSCSRGPLLGFKHLLPPFTIYKVPCDVPIWASIGGQDVEHLPSASTCANTLKLPTYKRATTLKNKLLYAISSSSGFELS